MWYSQYIGLVFHLPFVFLEWFQYQRYVLYMKTIMEGISFFSLGPSPSMELQFPEYFIQLTRELRGWQAFHYLSSWLQLQVIQFFEFSLSLHVWFSCILLGFRHIWQFFKGFYLKVLFNVLQKSHATKMHGGVWGIYTPMHPATLARSQTLRGCHLGVNMAWKPTPILHEDFLPRRRITWFLRLPDVSARRKRHSLTTRKMQGNKGCFARQRLAGQ